jgi:hypothetical protein
MLSIQRLCQCITAIVLLKTGLATNINDQTLLSPIEGDKKDSPWCKDIFYARMYVPRNTTGSDKLFPVFHRDGRVYAMKDKDPTQWAIQKKPNGRYTISSAHPSGMSHWWYKYDRDIAVGQYNYQAKELSFAEAVESDRSSSKLTVFWDDQCLVIPDDESKPLMMLSQSACDPIILKFTEPLQWKAPNETCKHEKTMLDCKYNLLLPCPLLFSDKVL